MKVLSYIAVYLIIMNLAGFVFMAIDKRKARRNKWRIPEAILFLFAIFGGSAGCLLGMHVFHHKTQKPRFYIGIPVILTIQLLAVAYLVFLAPLNFVIM